jgi:hypothetical protein
MDAAGVIAHYVMDGDRPLTAETGGNINFYLYGPSAGSGWGAIGEKTAAWSYSLPDGTAVDLPPHWVYWRGCPRFVWVSCFSDN